MLSSCFWVCNFLRYAKCYNYFHVLDNFMICMLPQITLAFTAQACLPFCLTRLIHFQYDFCAYLNSGYTVAYVHGNCR